MTAEADFLGKGWEFPVSLDLEAGKHTIAMSRGDDCIRESIFIILGTAKGERVMRPDFGCVLNELVFEPNDTATSTLVAYHVKEALLKWEPRIEVLEVRASYDEDEGNKININIDYKVKTTNSRANLVYPFYLETGK